MNKSVYIANSGQWYDKALNNFLPNNVLKDICILNDTYREKLCHIQFNKRMADWLLLNFLICLHNQLSSIIHFIITYQ